MPAHRARRSEISAIVGHHQWRVIVEQHGRNAEAYPIIKPEASAANGALLHNLFGDVSAEATQFERVITFGGSHTSLVAIIGIAADI